MRDVAVVERGAVRELETRRRKTRKERRAGRSEMGIVGG